MKYSCYANAKNRARFTSWHKGREESAQEGAISRLVNAQFTSFQRVIQDDGFQNYIWLLNCPVKYLSYE